MIKGLRGVDSFRSSSDVTGERSFEQLRADYNQFLKVYELPTQLYRLLRKRQETSPYYLRRNLTYMRKDGNKKQKRKNFRVNDMLTQLQENEEQTPPAGNFHFTFEAFHSPAGKKEKELTLEPILVRISQRSGRSKQRGAYSAKEVKLAPRKVQRRSGYNDENDDDDGAETGDDGNDGTEGTFSCDVSIPYASLLDVERVDNALGALHSYVLRVRVTLGKEEPVQKETEQIKTDYDDLQWDSIDSEQSSFHSDDDKDKDKDKTSTTDYPKRFDVHFVLYDATRDFVCEEGDYELCANRVKSFGSFPLKTIAQRRRAKWDDCSQAGPVIRKRLGSNMALKEYLKFSFAWDGCHPIHVFSPRRYCKRARHAKIGKTKSENVTSKGSALSSSSSSSSSLSCGLGFGAVATKRRHRSVVVQNGGGGGGGVDALPSPEQIMFRYLYDGNARQQTEVISDLACCWCRVKCPTLCGLLKHLQLCHPRFLFTYTPQPKVGQIDVRLNECYGAENDDGDVVQRERVLPSRRHFPRKRKSSTSVLVSSKNKRLRFDDLTEFMVKEPSDGGAAVGLSPQIKTDRVYYHSTTSMPLSSESDVDSEIEIDPPWMRANMKMMINEFTDVNDAEKEMMKLWNLHVMRINPFADAHMASICRQFVEKYGRDVVEKNLVGNFIFHLANLSNYQLISPTCVSECMRTVRRIQASGIREDVPSRE
ncbi:polycomb protein suz12-like [Oscarella lobularis]|uniref:polycomb protein suz12-like n=1 Tax=Oscarella lobularis TaxID=121494 RepID=UPI003314475D